MNRFLFCLAATVIAFNAVAGSSPNEDRRNNEPVGTVTLDQDGATMYVVDDGQTYGWTGVVTLPKGPNEYNSGIIVFNRASKPTSVNTGSGSYDVASGTSTFFSYREKKWINTRNTPITDSGPSGPVFIPPSKAP
ncbi:hypothetical protein [Pseudomonas sp. HMWF021]|uniref:hypothetical protein n=1 Tax=Pseudomonas sp. HMWF021 TaxID=2056857 RepID=UPI0011B258F7|nr:hypothetical protein [Pseudomonas sp. HMWF021]